MKTYLRCLTLSALLCLPSLLSSCGPADMLEGTLAFLAGDYATLNTMADTHINSKRQWTPCAECNGTGKLYNSATCEECNGWGGKQYFDFSQPTETPAN